MSGDAASRSSRESVAVPDEGIAASPRTRRRVRSHRRAANNRHRRLRMMYFALASVWGFAAGSVAVLAGFNALGHPIRFDSGLGFTLGAAGVIAIVGGVIVSLAYREAVRRGM